MKEHHFKIMYFTKKVIWLKYFFLENTWQKIAVEVCSHWSWVLGSWEFTYSIHFCFLLLSTLSFSMFFWTGTQFHFLIIYIYFMFMDVLPACMSIHHMYTVLIEAEKGIISPGPLCGLLFRGSGFDPPRTTWWLKTIFVCACDSLQDFLKLTCNCRKRRWEGRRREEGREDITWRIGWFFFSGRWRIFTIRANFM